jgi:hypothetical protein
MTSNSNELRAHESKHERTLVVRKTATMSSIRPMALGGLRTSQINMPTREHGGGNRPPPLMPRHGACIMRRDLFSGVASLSAPPTPLEHSLDSAGAAALTAPVAPASLSSSPTPLKHSLDSAAAAALTASVAPASPAPIQTLLDTLSTELVSVVRSVASVLPAASASSQAQLDCISTVIAGVAQSNVLASLAVPLPPDDGRVSEIEEPGMPVRV